jgi:hypothetical protein
LCAGFYLLMQECKVGNYLCHAQAMVDVCTASRIPLMVFPRLHAAVKWKFVGPCMLQVHAPHGTSLEVPDPNADAELGQRYRWPAFLC